MLPKIRSMVRVYDLGLGLRLGVYVNAHVVLYNIWASPHMAVYTYYGVHLFVCVLQLLLYDRGVGL